MVGVLSRLLMIGMGEIAIGCSLVALVLTISYILQNIKEGHVS
jgi:hypothetical protein